MIEQNINDFISQFGSDPFSMQMGFNLLSSLTNLTLNFCLTLPCVLMFLDAYRENHKDLMQIWGLCTVAAVATSSIVSSALTAAVFGIVFPPIAVILTPAFFFSCAVKAGLLLATAILASNHKPNQNIMTTFGFS